MKEMELFQADRMIEFFKGPLDSILIREIITCLKRMGSVEADPHSLMVMYPFDNFFDLIKGVSNFRPLSCCVLHEENDRILNLFKGLIDSSRDCLDCFIF